MIRLLHYLLNIHVMPVIIHKISAEMFHGSVSVRGER